MSSYDDDLRQALEVELKGGQVHEVGESGPIFHQLSKIFPSIGSKIDWKRVPGSIEWVETDESLQLQRLIEFFDEVCERFQISGPVLYVGDSATDIAVEGQVDAIRRVLPGLLGIPQHHYFIGSDFTWCICLTMEGDMGFGRSTPPSCH